MYSNRLLFFVPACWYRVQRRATYNSLECQHLKVSTYIDELDDDVEKDTYSLCSGEE
jgi:hypothetical protein